MKNKTKNQTPAPLQFVNVSQMCKAANGLENKIAQVENVGIKCFGLTAWAAAMVFNTNNGEEKLTELVERHAELTAALDAINQGPCEYSDPYGLTIDEKKKRDAYIQSIDGQLI
tara:strand:- start:308 stop:649 length:342 start_codon:yes stop_codon:yes gene_type:complete